MVNKETCAQCGKQTSAGSWKNRIDVVGENDRKDVPEFVCFECQGIDVEAELAKEKTCARCGKPVAGRAGRWLNKIEGEGENDRKDVPEFVCFECEPVDLTTPEPPVSPGGDN